MDDVVRRFLMFCAAIITLMQVEVFVFLPHLSDSCCCEAHEWLSGTCTKPI